MHDQSDSNTSWSTPIPVRSLDRRNPREVSLAPDAETRAALARELGIVAIRKLTLDGAISPASGSDWSFDGRLGATVVQECVVTLAPVTTRIDESVSRHFVADFTDPEIGSETEMPADDTVEPLSDAIDPGAIMAEALALALPLYPKADGAELENTQFTKPGETPMSDDDAKPFAVLKALKDKLGENDK